ncbi:hypothetical protein [Pseudoalteromonas piscicida]|uniref:hypothetical protein n=1 Tax=Pseudoalteromonas piscicida TaxID=43662 RepID=UPI0030AF3BA9
MKIEASAGQRLNAKNNQVSDEARVTASTSKKVFSVDSATQCTNTELTRSAEELRAKSDDGKQITVGVSVVYVLISRVHSPLIKP